MRRPNNTLARVSEIEWQLTLNRGLADIHRAAGTKRKDILEAIYGTKSQERRVAA